MPLVNAASPAKANHILFGAGQIARDRHARAAESAVPAWPAP